MTKEERARERAHGLLAEVHTGWALGLMCDLSATKPTCDRLTAFILAAETELHRIEGERDVTESLLAVAEAHEREFRAVSLDMEGRWRTAQRERDSQGDRLQTLVDERFGIEPVLSFDELFDILESKLTAERLAAAALTRERDHWSEVATKRQEDLYAALRERDEARASLVTANEEAGEWSARAAVAREQALREAAKVVKGLADAMRSEDLRFTLARASRTIEALAAPSPGGGAT